MNMRMRLNQRCRLLVTLALSQLCSYLVPPVVFAGQPHANPKPWVHQLAERRESAVVLQVATSRYQLAEQWQAAASDRCVDEFFLAAALSWYCVKQCSNDAAQATQAQSLYHRSVKQLIKEGQKHVRLDPTSRLLINTPSGELIVPTAYHGFAWEPEHFAYLEPVRPYDSSDLRHVYRFCGLGVPAVVTYRKSCDHGPRTGFVDSGRPFAATVVLRSNLEALLRRYSRSADDGQPLPLKQEDGVATLEFHDPLRLRQLSVADRQVALAGDITAPLAYILQQEPRQFLQGFLRPGTSTGSSGMDMLEPYQQGRIPLVFVHGLLSERLTWANLANEIRADPVLMDRFQLWAFQYPTGKAFLESAADFRGHFQCVFHTMAPLGDDPSFSQSVLVGHSMGGLLAKLQVTYSGTCLWDSVSRRPFHQVDMPPSTRAYLSRLFFFQPSPFVDRVVFVGTPHDGSSIAGRPIGRLGSALVKLPQEDRRRHRQLMRTNRFNFVRSVRRRVPTSIDLLRPRNPVLAAMRHLPIAEDVKLHSVIGTGRNMLIGGPADGVVPVASALHPGVESQLYVPARHRDLHSHPSTSRFVIEILQQHGMQEVVPARNGQDQIPMVGDVPPNLTR